MEFGVTALLRPEIEWDRGEFVDHRIGQAIFREINRLKVDVAGVAALDAHVGKLISSIDREFGLVFLAASSTDDAAELPFAQTQTADQVAPRAIALLAENADTGLAIAERAQRMAVSVELQACVRADEFSIRLKKSEGQEFLRSVGWFVRRGPAIVQQVRPGTGRCVVQIPSDLGELVWRSFFYQREKCRETA